MKKEIKNKKTNKSKLILVLAFIAIIIPLIAANCGGPPPATPGFTVSANSLAVTQGESGTTQVTVSPSGGFSDMVSLSLEGAPAAVTSSFNPASTDSTSTLTITVPASVSPGTYPLRIKGQANSLIKTSPEFNLLVNAKVDNGAFELSASSVTITKSEIITSDIEPQLLPHGTVAVSITRKNGFSGAIDLKLEGLPTGITPTFTPNPATGNTSSLRLEVTSAAPVGSHSVTIKGKSGGKEASTVFNLTIEERASNPDFSLDAGNITIKRGTTVSKAIIINREDGFSAAVNLSVSALPTGVSPSGSAGFSPNPATNTSTLTLSASATAALGDKTLTVTGTAGGKTRTRIIKITVTDAAPVPDFTISANDKTIRQGNTSLVSITINKTGGFTGNVSLTKTGIPDDVTAVFQTTGATTFLRLTVGLGAARTAKTITITGTAAGKTHSTSFKLTVKSPDSAAIVAYAWADNKTSASYTPNTNFSYNKFGGAIEAKRLALGQYSIEFPGLKPGVNVQVTALLNSEKAHCQFRGGSGNKLLVACFNSSGFYRDATYYISVTKKGITSNAKPIAYVYAHKIDNTRHYAPTGYSYNAAAGAIDLDWIGIGKYMVKFNDLNASYANLQVTAYKSNRYCISGGAFGGLVAIYCYDQNGNLANSRYTLAVIAKGIASTAKVMAYALVGSVGGSQYPALESDSFTSSDGKITIQHIGTGRYSVAFAGLNLGSQGGNIQVVAKNGFNHCNVSNWTLSSVVDIDCYNSSGVPVDGMFTIIIYK